MGKLHKIRIKSDKFISNMEYFIVLSIELVEKQLLEMNKQQMMANKDATGSPLVNRNTGSEYLSPAYALKTGKRKPNLFLTGSFQNDMFLNVSQTATDYFIDSYDKKSGWLVGMYGKDIFGIEDKITARTLTGLSFRKLYIKNVLR